MYLVITIAIAICICASIVPRMGLLLRSFDRSIANPKPAGGKARARTVLFGKFATHATRAQAKNAHRTRLRYDSRMRNQLRHVLGRRAGEGEPASHLHHHRFVNAIVIIQIGYHQLATAQLQEEEGGGGAWTTTSLDFCLVRRRRRHCLMDVWDVLSI